MATAGTVSYGKCFLCGGSFAKNGITRHLKACIPKHEAGRTGKRVRLFHLRAEGWYRREYWLHLEVPASYQLYDLDTFLRAIWVECCDHLSAFRIGGVFYELDTGMVDAMWKEFFGPSLPTRSMGVKLYNVLSVGEEFEYEYDFGTTTRLRLKVLGERKGFLDEQGIRVLARNYAPDYRCKACGKPAAWLYVYAEPQQVYCERHARERDEGLLPIVNSPRVGCCGYDGPYNPSLAFEERYEPGGGR